MDCAVAVISGALVGLVGCAAPVALFERALRGDGAPSLAAGIASVGVSFVFLTLALSVVYTATVDGLLEFGGSMVASFLLVWAVEAVRGWRSANGGR